MMSSSEPESGIEGPSPKPLEGTTQAAGTPKNAVGVVRKKTSKKVLLIPLLIVACVMSLAVYRSKKFERESGIMHLRDRSGNDVKISAYNSHLRHDKLSGGAGALPWDEKLEALRYERAMQDPKSAHTFPFVIIADLDKQSRTTHKGKEAYYSYIKTGTVRRDPATGKFSVSWERDIKITASISEAGRGLELSELVMFNGHLYTFDDRTGVVFELHNTSSAAVMKAIPRTIVMEGDGDTEKGQKLEWATVKDGQVSSHPPTTPLAFNHCQLAYTAT
jgi:hypothetical protein